MAAYWKRNRALLITAIVVLAFILLVTRGMETKVWMSVLLSGITLASLYFLVASGLSLIFGLMDVLNFAHGAIFVAGAFVGLSTFMNPRLLFNTIPFFLAVTAGAILSQHFGVYLWRRVNTKTLRNILWAVFFALAIAIIAFSLRRFPIRAINAFNVTAVGGIVSTADAQEPLSLMIQRTALLILGGLPFGLLSAPKQRHEEGQRRPNGQIIATAAGMILFAFLLLFIRDSGETFLLGLSVNTRFLLALIFGALAGMLLGMAIEIVLIRPFYGNPVTQLVLTLGLSIALTDLVEGIWGEEGNPPMEPPTLFSGACRSDNLLTWFSEGCRS
ncbi:MAG TPA: hypothetical protein DEH22_06555, partial [Chloroflexi bacterium]|nr:hypothetical protein [Chloroflexota bacterium]